MEQSRNKVRNIITLRNSKKMLTFPIWRLANIVDGGVAYGDLKSIYKIDISLGEFFEKVVQLSYSPPGRLPQH